MQTSVSFLYTSYTKLEMYFLKTLYTTVAFKLQIRFYLTKDVYDQFIKKLNNSDWKMFLKDMKNGKYCIQELDMWYKDFHFFPEWSLYSL